MLSSHYYSIVNTAERKSSGQRYRNRTARELIESYERFDHNIVEKSRILYDVARLLGMHREKASSDWKFTAINSINLDNRWNKNTDPEVSELLDDASKKIDGFKRSLFTNFNDFEKFWRNQKFATVQEFLDAFYRYVPYAKLGINEEPEVRNLAATAGSLTSALARQRAVFRRINDVFLRNVPDDLPEAIIESLVDFAARTGEESIPLEASNA